MDKQDPVDLLHGDFQKAFDEVSHLRWWRNKVVIGLEERSFYEFAKRLQDTKVMAV